MYQSNATDIDNDDGDDERIKRSNPE